MKKIHTYYEPVSALDPENELKLMLLWRERWEAVGFTPYVISEWHAQQHPFYPQWDKYVRSLPSVNPEGYERACWMRWLALAQVGGGHMSDYDVIPYGDITPFICTSEVGLIIYQHEPGHGACPSLVHTNVDPVDWCKEVMATKAGFRDQDGKPHASDMYAFEDLFGRGIPWLKSKDVVKLYTEDGWQTSKAVHYSNSTMTPAGKVPRYQHIPLLRPCTPNTNP